MKQNKNYLVNFMKLSEFLQRQITVSFVYLLVDVTNKNSLDLFYPHSPIKEGSSWPAID